MLVLGSPNSQCAEPAAAANRRGMAAFQGIASQPPRRWLSFIVRLDVERRDPVGQGGRGEMTSRACAYAAVADLHTPDSACRGERACRAAGCAQRGLVRSGALPPGGSWGRMLVLGSPNSECAEPAAAANRGPFRCFVVFYSLGPGG